MARETHVSSRGVPDTIAAIHYNWFYNPNRPSPGRGNETVIQPHVGSFTNLELGDIHYGQDIPSENIGCPRT